MNAQESPTTASTTAPEPKFWFVLRDLKRPNAKRPAYRQLSDEDFEVFTPMKDRLVVRDGKQIRETIPFIRDLLFVHTTRSALDPVLEKSQTIQYRYVRGGYKVPMVVDNADMERFLRVVRAADALRYYLRDEINQAMVGHDVRIIGGPMDGCEGKLMSVRGSRTKRLMVELPGFFAAAAEVNNSEFIKLL